MTIAHLLPDFTGPLAAPPEPPEPAEDPQEVAQGFEEGYAAGWQAAEQARDADVAHISAALARNLQDLSFTYHEAQSQLLQSLRELFVTILDRLLPAVARGSLLPQLAEELTALAQEGMSAELRIVTAAENVPAIEQLLTQDFGFPLSVSAEATLGEGQVYLQLGETEKQLDYDALLAGMARAAEAFFAENRKDTDDV